MQWITRTCIAFKHHMYSSNLHLQICIFFESAVGSSVYPVYLLIEILFHWFGIHISIYLADKWLGAKPFLKAMVTKIYMQECIWEGNKLSGNRGMIIAAIVSTILIACDTSYKNCGHEISIPLDFVVKDYFLSNCDNHIAIPLVGRASKFPNVLYGGYGGISWKRDGLIFANVNVIYSKILAWKRDWTAKNINLLPWNRERVQKLTWKRENTNVISWWDPPVPPPLLLWPKNGLFTCLKYIRSDMSRWHVNHMRWYTHWYICIGCSSGHV